MKIRIQTTLSLFFNVTKLLLFFSTDKTFSRFFLTFLYFDFFLSDFSENYINIFHFINVLSKSFPCRKTQKNARYILYK